MSLFTKINIASKRSDLATIAESDISYLTNDELTAWGQWDFKSSATSLTSLYNNRALSVIGGATVAPTYDASSMTLKGSTNNGLLSTLSDASLSGYTVAAVVKFTSPINTSMLFGTFDGTTGASPFLGSQTKIYLSAKNSISSLAVSNTLTADTYYYVAMSVDFVAGKVNFLVKNPVEDSRVTDSAGTFVRASKNIGIGNSYYTSSSTTNLVYSEAVIFDSAKSMTDLLSLYARAKTRVSKKGISI